MKNILFFSANISIMMLGSKAFDPGISIIQVWKNRYQISMIKQEEET